MLVQGHEFFLGCDPEVFVRDKKTKAFISAHGLIPGTKAAPHKVPGGMVQVDGMALEFGIDPARTEDEFTSSIVSVVQQLAAMLPRGLELAFCPIANFSQEIINNSPPEALELGCDPDYNAYTLERNPPPHLTDPCLRSAGGHVHIGWGANIPFQHPTHLKDCAALTAELDLQLGAVSLFWDNDDKRRSLYGAAGAFRPKPYGMEYRTLSNQWLLKEELIRFVYRQTIKAVENTLLGKNSYDHPVNFYAGTVTISPREIISQNFVLGSQILAKKAELDYVQ